MAQDHIIFTLVHFNGCAGVKAPHSIIFNGHLTVAKSQDAKSCNAKAYYSNRALLFGNDALPN
jgi:hypothetical protein